MTDEEYYEFIQPYEDAKQMLLTRLDVLNHNLYGDASARPIHKHPMQDQEETEH